ncbi:DNA polymerase V [Lachnospiraceae bacterium XBD2001]|nr:DNA polymerase V [Lachnospiraceae bacterium XBD2001]
MKKRTYLCIDLKSFYASVECAERGLDPMTTRLVVADPTRTDKTICLAISPAMKALGIHNRCRVFEIPKGIDYIMAPPRMQKYLDYSAEIYGIYLKYISKQDIYVYSVDEAFMDVTEYLNLYGMTAKELGQRIMQDIYDTVHVRATCGIGSNLYLTKIALDITAKHADDFIGELDEESYCKTLWDHKPLTDFWRIGGGIARRLAPYGIYTMGDIARADEDLLYRLFGIDAELLIDHAWGREPVTIADIKNYHTRTKSITSGQVLMCDYNYEDGKLIVKEMADLICLDLVEKKLLTKSITLHVGYSNRLNVPPAHGTVNLGDDTNADMIIIPAMMKLYEEIINPNYDIRRVNISCNNVIPEEFHQYSFFTDAADLERNHKIQEAVIELKYKFGKDAVMKGMNLEEKGTTRERNHQIGGHRSGD